MAITKIQSESLNLADTYAFTGTVTGAGGVMTPYFEAYIAANQSPSDNVDTKVNFDTETYDSGGMYDTTNKRFLPTVAGKYFIYTHLCFSAEGVDRFHSCILQIRKNGAKVKSIYYDDYDNYMSYVKACTGHCILDMNGSSDYVEIYGNMNFTAGQGVFYNARFSTFGGYRIIE